MPSLYLSHQIIKKNRRMMKENMSPQKPTQSTHKASQSPHKDSQSPLKVSQSAYNQLLDNERELSDYLHYIRHQKPPTKIKVSYPHFEKAYSKEDRKVQPKVNAVEVGAYVEKYLLILKEVNSLQSYAIKKIFKKTLQFLQEFPTISFLCQVSNSFGKDQKKLSLNEQAIRAQATDDMIPLFQKIIERIECLKKESESKKLLELGHRIQHLQDMISSSKDHSCIKDPEVMKMFKTYEADRVEKYLIMEDSIMKAEKRFGNFSQNFIKNREIFSNLNRVYQDIKNHERN